MKVVMINPHLVFVPELQIHDVIETDEHTSLVVISTFKNGFIRTRHLATGDAEKIYCSDTTRVLKRGYLVEVG